MIHPTHSKKDLIEICEVFNIELLDIYDLKKDELVNEIEQALEYIDYIEPEDIYYYISDIQELKDYLISPNQGKSLSISGRERMIMIARDIIYYCRNGFNINPKFKNIEELIDSAKTIAIHGDISTCRRALGYLKDDTKIRPSIEPVLSNRMKKQLERKEELRKRNVGKLTSAKGKFLLSFD
jgi:hypothetical protein